MAFVVVFFSQGCRLADKNEFVILSDNTHSIFCEVDHGNITQRIQLPFPGEPPGIVGLRRLTIKDSLNAIANSYDNLICNQNGWIAYLDYDSATIKIAKYLDDSLTLKPDIILPVNFMARSLAFKGNMLYVGGSGDDKALGFYDLSKDRYVWYPIFLPISKNTEPKGIRNIFVKDDTLFVMRMWGYSSHSYYIDISDQFSPRIIDSTAFTISDHCKQAIATDKYIILLYKNIIFNSVESSISIYNMKNLELIAMLTNSEQEDYTDFSYKIDKTYRLRLPKKDSTLMWESISILKNYLLLACGDYGVGLFDLNALADSAQTGQIVRDILSYLRPDSIPRGQILKIIPHNAINKVTVFVRIENEFRSYLINSGEFNL